MVTKNVVVPGGGVNQGIGNRGFGRVARGLCFHSHCNSIVRREEEITCELARGFAGAAPLLLWRELPFLGVVHHRANIVVAAVIHFARAATGDGSD